MPTTAVAEDAQGTSPIAAYSYIGSGTVIASSRPEFEDGLTLSFGSAQDDYAGWDRFGRVLSYDWREDDQTLVDGYGYTYDRNSNPLTRDNKHATAGSAFDEAYAYDDLNRLVDVTRDSTSLQDWTLDAQGNWTGFTDRGDSQTRTVNAVNEIGAIGGDLDWIDPAYDLAGNMISGPSALEPTARVHHIFDAWNRLTEVRADDNGDPGELVSAYAYDAANRRSATTRADDSSEHYYYDASWQMIEQRDHSAPTFDPVDPFTVIRQTVVYDPFAIDRPILRDRLAEGTLDWTFGDGGVLASPISDIVDAVTQSDGKIVVVGYDFDLARLNADGSLDTTFGDDGIASVEVGWGGAWSRRAALDDR